jgi:hypothetical protein
MDLHSDLDLGILFQNPSDRNVAWKMRWDWPIAPWFHRLDADHIKSHFVIYLYDPYIKADINLYIVDELPPLVGGPYLIVWDKMGFLEQWVKVSHGSQVPSPDWGGVLHEDERFWAWMFYLYTHVHRGEYYHVAYEFPAIRDILEKWTARLAGFDKFNSRRLENHDFADLLLENDLFPRPDKESMKMSMVNAIGIQLKLRNVIKKQLDIEWKTDDHAVKMISKFVESL